MSDQLITAGEFAKLASITKRTIIWYDKMGILLPYKIDPNGYRYYLPKQILDFQAILLLRKLNFSIEEIKSLLAKGNNIKDLFRSKRSIITEEIERLQMALSYLDGYYDNLDKNGTLVAPVVKDVKAFEVYYIEKVGSYSKIKEYGEELYSYFEEPTYNPVFLTIFLDQGYRPAKSRMKIAVSVERGMRLKKEYEGKVQKEIIPSYKCLSYTYKGPGSLLSLLWKEVEKYARKNGYKWNKNLSFTDIEFYYNTAREDIIFEINLPIN